MRQKRWLKSVGHVKQLFFNFLLAMLNNYRPFLKEDPKSPRRFEVDNEGYLAIIPRQCLEFYQELTKTMMFLQMS